MSLCFPHAEQTDEHQGREDQRGEDARTQTAAAGARDEARQRRPASAAKVPSQRQQGEHGRSPVPDRRRCTAERPRPENADREARDRAADQTQDRRGHEDDAAVGRDAQKRAGLHIPPQVELPAVPAEQCPGNAHGRGEGHRAFQVPHRLRHAEALLGKGGGPLAHRLLRRTGAEHHEHEDPEQLLPAQLAQQQGPGLAALDGIERRAGEENTIGQRDKRPQKGHDLPLFDAENSEKRRGQQHDGHMAPAVERVQEAHVALLVVRRAGLHDRADQHLEEPAAQRVDGHGGRQPGRGIRKYIRQDRQQHEPRRGERVREQDRRAVADAVKKPGRQQIDAQLDAEIHGDEQRDPGQRDLVAPLEHNEQQRNKIIDDRLHDITGIAGIDRPLAGVFHGEASE